MSLAKRIISAIPEATLGTDIIVGFPGETEEEFNETVDLCIKVGFKIAFISEYSIRPGTGASLMKDSSPNWDKKRRFQILDELINKVPHSKISTVKIGNTSKYLT
jgi:tRNA-2-methylthio-N6-dimethylallyladenosine synthase